MFYLLDIIIFFEKEKLLQVTRTLQVPQNCIMLLSWRRIKKSCSNGKVVTSSVYQYVNVDPAQNIERLGYSKDVITEVSPVGHD